MKPKEIKTLRLRLGWSQEKLARELHVSFCTVNRWELGKTMPSPMGRENLKKLKDTVENTSSLEKRASLRIHTACPVTFVPYMANEEAVSQDHYSSVADDISLGGMSFTTGKMFIPGEKLSMDIRLSEEDTPLKTLSEVRWLAEKNGRYNVGVRFANMGQGQTERLMKAMLSRPAMSC
ncbi:MAG: PilZ domain-containing protein [Deltaproteobacteria bacterium]|nr:PilZ domain-containing protein [Deltaproteobacteria bacterium]